jgi:hypothetical protein
MRTVVTSSNDALNILFQAAEHQNNSSEESSEEPVISLIKHASNSNAVHNEQTTFDTPGSVTSGATVPMYLARCSLSNPSPETMKAWASLRFVRQGWFSAQEACTYADLFFRNLSPLSPVLTDYYSHHENHAKFIATEPLLCCIILMISSRYHVLPGVGGASRGYFIHHRLWQHCQHLIQRVMFGQEKLSTAKTRTIGTIESLLLMVEWHPRSLHYPPESDGWDANLTMQAEDEKFIAQPCSDPHHPSKWLEEVIEPARRSDRMSWMLLGCALTLAHELSVFEDEDVKTSAENVDAALQKSRRLRLRSLLYVYINQLAARLGHSSLLPQSSYLPMIDRSLSTSHTEEERQWQRLMTSWIELTKLMRSVSSMFFPSVSFTRQLLSSGNYLGLLEHFRPLLSSWREKHLDNANLPKAFADMLFIEYQYVRIYTNSLAIQAVVERALLSGDNPSNQDSGIPSTSADPQDQEFIQEVIDGSKQILSKVLTLADAGQLLFSPVRIFLRITSSSIFLLKALGLGVSSGELKASLNVLEASIHALRSSTLDDMHLASRYATLLNVHVKRLRRKFVVSSRPTTLSMKPFDTNPPSRSRSTPPATSAPNGIVSLDSTSGAPVNEASNSKPMDMFTEDWFALPFDPSMAPFGVDASQVDLPGFDTGGLDFLWDIPDLGT